MILFIIFINILSADLLTEEMVIKSAVLNYPAVLNALNDVDIARAQLRRNRGNFDLKLKGAADIRVDGFYKGDAYKALIEQSFGPLNGTVYGGFKESFSNFPSYEGKFNTLDGGEVLFGGSVSLLRNLWMNYRLYKNRVSEEDLKQSKILLDKVMIQTQTIASQAYWNWVMASKKLSVFKDLLALAEKRASQIHRRIKAGDLASIYRVENNQYIQKRKSELLKSELAYLKASLYLSLFMRTESGEPIDVKAYSSPNESSQAFLAPSSSEQSYLKKALERSPDIKVLGSKVKQGQLMETLGRNDMLPKLDVKYDRTEDRGDGSSALRGVENRIMLNFELPIQNRKARGRRKAGSAKVNQALVKKKFLKEKLTVELKGTVASIAALSEQVKITETQEGLASQLAKAELRKFRTGASDLILVNFREEAHAQARVQNLQAKLKYHYEWAKFKQILFEPLYR